MKGPSFRLPPLALPFRMLHFAKVEDPGSQFACIYRTLLRMVSNLFYELNIYKPSDEKRHMNVGILPLRWVRAFTRTDLLAVLAAVAVLGTLVMPVLAGNRSQSERATCLNNLRLVGRGFHLWGSDHGERLPWIVATNEGGTSPKSNPLGNNAWYHFGALSNELSTPRLLVCPSDASRRLATEWSSSAEGGFLHPDYRNTALSYMLSVDGDPGLSHRLVLSGDRNVLFNSSGSCSLGFTFAYGLVHPFTSTVWTVDLHGNSGNLLLRDGQVRSTTSAQLRAVLLGSSAGFGTLHVVAP